MGEALPPGRLARALLASAALAACSGEGSAPEVRPDLVLVVVDTLRADHLHHAGYPLPHSPQLDRLKQQSTWFPNAYAGSSWTLPSLASLFVSEPPSLHGVVTWEALLDSRASTLAEALARGGYRTGGFSANFLVTRETGIPQGFEEYAIVYNFEAWQRQWGEGVLPSALGRYVTEQALAWIRAVRAESPRRPLFAYLHYMEPHTPYRCPDPADTACEREAEELAVRLVNRRWGFDAGEARRIVELYDGQVAAIDAALAPLLAELEAGPSSDRTWLVVTADHGESLGEEGLYLHGESLASREIRVPLLWSGPSRRGSRVETPVSLLDLAPTLLDLAGLPAPASFRGRSLRPALEGKDLAPAPVVAELFPRSAVPPRHRLAVIAGDEKLLVDAEGAVARVDLREDPGEAAPGPAGPEELERALGPAAAWIDLARQPVAPARELGPELRRQLEALGYGLAAPGTGP